MSECPFFAAHGVRLTCSHLARSRTCRGTLSVFLSYYSLFALCSLSSVFPFISGLSDVLVDLTCEYEPLIPEGGDPEHSYLAHGGMLYVSLRPRFDATTPRLIFPSLRSAVCEEAHG